jgi:hypothetical protein
MSKMTPEEVQAKPGKKNKFPKPNCPVHGFVMDVLKTQGEFTHYVCTAECCSETDCKKTK